jgi:POT family proton-dependent oligopeptide transporter
MLGVVHEPDPTAGAVRIKQPPGLFLLFGVEMWERFSFYGMRAMLVLFVADTATGGMGWSKEAADRLFGWYGFGAYSLPLAGGYVADRFLGTHRSMVIGACVIAAGHFCLAIPAPAAFFVGLALVAIGTGFFKPNVSTMVGQLYGERDPRRDGGFTIFYMGINVGGLLGPLVCAYLGESPRWGWHYGFAAAGVGMILGLGMYLFLRARYLPGIGLAPDRTRAAGPVAASTSVLPSAARPARLTRAERDCLIFLVVIMAFSIPFWTAFEQTGSSMNFFAAERTRRTIFGHPFPAGWLQSVNSAVLLTTAPIFAWMWTALARRGREPSTPVKVGAAMFMLALGFVFMVSAARASDGGALVSPFWLIATYTFHTFGELWMSPVGLSMVTKLAPLKFASLLMGLWFFATAIAEFLAGHLAALTDRVARGELFHVFGGQADFFLIFVISSTVSGILLLALAPALKRLAHGRDV